jgi:hypothetical protein
MSRMSEIALRLEELENGIADNSWSVDMVVAEINCLMDLGLHSEMEKAFNRGINRWYRAGMPKGTAEVSSEVDSEVN